VGLRWSGDFGGVESRGNYSGIAIPRTRGNTTVWKTMRAEAELLRGRSGPFGTETPGTASRRGMGSNAGNGSTA
jgi:hypothetical protein